MKNTPQLTPDAEDFLGGPGLLITSMFQAELELKYKEKRINVWKLFHQLAIIKVEKKVMLHTLNGQNILFLNIYQHMSISQWCQFYLSKEMESTTKIVHRCLTTQWGLQVAVKWISHSERTNSPTLLCKDTYTHTHHRPYNWAILGWKLTPQWIIDNWMDYYYSHSDMNNIFKNYFRKIWLF